MLSPLDLHAFAQQAETEMQQRITTARAERDLAVEEKLKAAIVDFEINQLGIGKRINMFENVFDQFILERKQLRGLNGSQKMRETGSLDILREEIIERSNQPIDLPIDEDIDDPELGDWLEKIREQENDRIAGSVSFQLHAFNARMRDAVAELNVCQDSGFERELIIKEYRSELRKVFAQSLEQAIYANKRIQARNKSIKVSKSLSEIWQGKQVSKNHKLEVLCKILQQIQNANFFANVRDTLIE